MTFHIVSTPTLPLLQKSSQTNSIHSATDQNFQGFFGVMGVMAAAAAADSGLQPAGKQLIFERLHFENQCNFTQI